MAIPIITQKASFAARNKDRNTSTMRIEAMPFFKNQAQALPEVFGIITVYAPFNIGRQCGFEIGQNGYADLKPQNLTEINLIYTERAMFLLQARKRSW